MNKDVMSDETARPLEAVSRPEELAMLLNQQIARADLSLRELQAKTDKMGGTRLARSTCSDMLAGRRFPRKAQMVTFLRACGVPEEQIPAWERAWERVRVARMPAVAGLRDRVGPDGEARPVTRPIGVNGAEPAKPVRAARAGRRRRRATVCAVLAAAAGLGMVAVLRTDRTVTDDGRAFGVGGSSRFTVTVDPANTGIRLTRRLDGTVGGQHATITVNGVAAGAWEPLPANTYGWVDQSVEIPAALTTGRRSLTIVNTFVASTVDFNEFRYTVHQRVGGVWSVADTVDVGPENTESEAAHGYRIIGETFRGVREFGYAPEPEHRRAG